MTNEQRKFITEIAYYLKDFIKSLEVRIAIGSQIALESNFGKSNIAKENNNLCGMKLAKLRPTLAIGENRKHAVYEKITDSINDLIIWIFWNKPTKTNLQNETNYLKWINLNYAEDEKYVEKIKKLINEYNNEEH